MKAKYEINKKENNKLKKNLKKYDEKFNGIDVWVEALHQWKQHGRGPDAAFIYPHSTFL